MEVNDKDNNESLATVMVNNNLSSFQSPLHCESMLRGQQQSCSIIEMEWNLVMDHILGIMFCTVT